MVMLAMAHTQGAVVLVPPELGFGVEVATVEVGEVSDADVAWAWPWIWICVVSRAVGNAEVDANSDNGEEEGGTCRVPVYRDGGVEIEVIADVKPPFAGGCDVDFVVLGCVDVIIVFCPLSTLALVNTVACAAELEEVLETFADAIVVVSGFPSCPVAGVPV